MLRVQTQESCDLRAVVFDMDGCLAPTESRTLETIDSLCKKQGIELSEGTRAKIPGHSWRLVADIIREQAGPDFPADRILEVADRALKAELIASGSPLKDGANDLLALLRGRGVKCAVASSGDAEWIECVIGCHRPKFDAVLSGQQVEHPKPAPDVFIKAAAMVGATPDQAMVVGDSAADIEGARRAGMIPILILDVIRPSPQIVQKAHAVVDSLRDIAGYFQALWARVKANSGPQ